MIPWPSAPAALFLALTATSLLMGLMKTHATGAWRRLWLVEAGLSLLALATVGWLLPAGLEALLRRGLGSQPMAWLPLWMLLATVLLPLLAALLEAWFAAAARTWQSKAVRRVPFWIRLSLHGGLALLALGSMVVQGRGTALRAATAAKPECMPELEVLFLAQNQWWRVRPSSGQPPRPCGVAPEGGETHLAIRRDPDSRGWVLHLVARGTSQKTLGTVAPPEAQPSLWPPTPHALRKGLSFHLASPPDPGPLPAVVAGTEPFQAWEVVPPTWARPELRVTSTAIAPPQALRMDLPLALWVPRWETLIANRWVLAQWGPQIVLWDLATQRLHRIARGSSPVAILHPQGG